MVRNPFDRLVSQYSDEGDPPALREIRLKSMGGAGDERGLDFIVIGAQKAGTTSLWHYLRHHPRLCLPASKEAPFFTAPDPHLGQLQPVVRKMREDAPAGALIGKVTPDYMVGGPGVPVEEVAERIAVTFPDALLIALLRDPIDRAVSSYVMAVRRGVETRAVDSALGEQLDPGRVTEGRREPTPTNTYVAAGEYGRILSAYRSHFGTERLLVSFTEDLDRQPGALLDGVLEFLGLEPGYRPDGLEVRHFQGGTDKIVDPEAERLLFKYFDEEILPHMRGPRAVHRRAFAFFYETWNVRPAPPPPLGMDIRIRLAEHFRADGEVLRNLGLRPPWLSGWGEGA